MPFVGCIADAASPEPVHATLVLQCLPENALMEAACEAAGECEALQLQLLVQPSTAPHGIVLVLDDTALETMVLQLAGFDLGCARSCHSNLKLSQSLLNGHLRVLILLTATVYVPFQQYAVLCLTGQCR